MEIPRQLSRRDFLRVLPFAPAIVMASCRPAAPPNNDIDTKKRVPIGDPTLFFSALSIVGGLIAGLILIATGNNNVRK